MLSRFALNNNYNIRKGFLNPNRMITGQFDAKYDEPTYLTFKLRFFSEETNTDTMTFDTLPQALFAVPTKTSSLLNWSTDAELRQNLANYQYSANSFKEDHPYSAIQYLLDRNEDFRAYQLAKFLKGWDELQEQYQYYFQSISGLDVFFKTSPDKGARLSKDAVITIECLEGIDQKIKYLLSLYRSAAWDDEYQRWILPDIYRFFKMDIYISEIRTFHSSVYNDATVKGVNISGSALNLVSNFAMNYTNKGLGFVNNKIADATKGGLNSNINISLNTLNVINNIAPVTCIRCELCDFDTTANLYNASYNINNSEQEKTTFKVKVKKAEIIYNWTLMDRIYGNLLTKWERGRESMLSENGMVDFLGVDGAVLSQSYFNNTSKMAKIDLIKNYSDALTSGWLGTALTDGVNSVKGLANNFQGSNAEKTMAGINFAADIYNNIRSAKSQKDMTDEASTLSKATERSREEANFQINIVGSALQTPDILEAAALVADNTDVQNEQIQHSMDLLRDLGTQYQDLSIELQQQLQDALDSIELTSMVGFRDQMSNYDRSRATDLDGGRELEGLIMSSNEFPETNMTGIVNSELELNFAAPDIQGEDDRSWATDLDGGPYGELTGLVDTELNLELTAPQLQDEPDRSWATDLDGGPYGELTGLVDTELNLELIPPQLQGEPDRSWATELDGMPNGSDDLTGIIDSSLDLSLIPPQLQGEDDRSWATELDGMPNGSDNLTGIIDSNLELELIPPQLQGEDDRSWATELDGMPNGSDNLTGLIESELNLDLIPPQLQEEPDRSWATELDGMPNGSDNLTELIPTDIDLELIPPQLQEEPDRSWATELDGMPNGSDSLTELIPTDFEFELIPPQLQEEPDRSWATELDGGPYGDLTGIIDSSLDLNLIPPQLQEEPDRSWATDLDGGPYGDLTGIIDNELEFELIPPQLQEEPDRSWATDLDGGPYGDLTGVIDSELNLELIAPQLQEEDDRSWATDLDGGSYGDLTGVLDNNLEFELLAPEIQDEPDRSWATDLDGGPYGDLTGVLDSNYEPTLVAPELVDNGLLLSDALTSTDNKEVSITDSLISPITTETETTPSLIPVEIKEVQQTDALIGVVNETNEQIVAMASPIDRETTNTSSLIPIELKEVQQSNNLTPQQQNQLEHTATLTPIESSEVSDADRMIGTNSPIVGMNNNLTPQSIVEPIQSESLISQNISELEHTDTLIEPKSSDVTQVPSLTPVALTDNSLTDALTPVTPTENIQSANLTPTVLSEVTQSANLTPVKMTESSSTPNLISQDLRSNDEPQGTMSSTDLNETEKSQPNLVKLNSFTLSSSVTGQMQKVNLTEPTKPTMTDVKLQQETDRSKATDLDDVPSMNTSSIFDQIVRSRATSRTTMNEVKLVDNNQPNPNPNLVVLPDGKINPEATVADIINQISEINEYKQEHTEISGKLGTDKEVVRTTLNQFNYNGYIDDSDENQNGKDKNLQTKIEDRGHQAKMIDVRLVDSSQKNNNFTKVEITDNSEKNKKVQNVL